MYGNTVISGSSSREDRKIAAFTQQLVWESLGYDPGTFLDSSIQSEYNTWRENVLNTVANMEKLVSFNGNHLTLNVGETTTLTDTNGKLAEYPTINETRNGIKFEHTNGSNDLKITITDSCTVEEYTFYSREIGLNLHYGGNLQTVYLYSEGYQKNMYTNTFGIDPAFRLDLNINLTGKLELTKTNTNGDLIDGSKFHVWSNDTGYDEIITVSGGKIVIENLKPGLYFIKEQSTGSTGYLLNTETYSVNVKSNETAAQTIVNDEPTRNNNGNKGK